jgi:hypothetical protein
MSVLGAAAAVYAQMPGHMTAWGRALPELNLTIDSGSRHGELNYGIANPASQHLIPTVTNVVGDESGSGTFIHPSVLNLHTMLGGVQQLDHLHAASTFCFPTCTQQMALSVAHQF